MRYKFRVIGKQFTRSVLQLFKMHEVGLESAKKLWNIRKEMLQLDSEGNLNMWGPPFWLWGWGVPWEKGDGKYPHRPGGKSGQFFSGRKRAEQRGPRSAAPLSPVPAPEPNCCSPAWNHTAPPRKSKQQRGQPYWVSPGRPQFSPHPGVKAPTGDTEPSRETRWIVTRRGWVAASGGQRPGMPSRDHTDPTTRMLWSACQSCWGGEALLWTKRDLKYQSSTSHWLGALYWPMGRTWRSWIRGGGGQRYCEHISILLCGEVKDSAPI